MIITLQIDEFQYIDKDILAQMLNLLASYFITEGHNLFFVVQLSGTDTETGIQSINLSKLKPTATLLSSLDPDEDLKLLKIELQNNQHLKGLLERNIYKQAVETMGRVPRLLATFISVINAKQKKVGDISEFLSSVLSTVKDEIASLYQIEEWIKIFENKNGLIQTIIWALCGRHVKLDDFVGGKSINNIRSSGVLMLQPVEESKDYYTIHMPSILLRALNTKLDLIDDQFLDPTRFVDAELFEQTVCAVHILRQSMLSALESTVAYSDLYPGAVASPELLNQRVSLKPIVKVKCHSLLKNDSMHNYPLNAVPIHNHTAPTVDLTQVTNSLFCANVREDGLLVHPPKNIEENQDKSSLYISYGKAPQNELLMSDIRKEFSKVSCKEHQSFYQQLDPQARFDLFIISNKPLKDYDKIKEATEKQDKSEYMLPPNIAVICNQNFKQYFGCFAGPCVYIPEPAASKIFEGLL
jgi:hypothetical protein